WFGIEPAWARGVTRAGFFELASDFPRDFVFGLICASHGNPTAEETHNECTQPEKRCRFHSANFISARAMNKPILSTLKERWLPSRRTDMTAEKPSFLSL
ncbi:MAG: hypothetical protein DME33_15005, partial [Verrucomicrobia bacterium]